MLDAAPSDFVEVDEVGVVLETDKASGSTTEATKHAATSYSPVKETATSVDEDLANVSAPSMDESISEGTVVSILKSRHSLSYCADIRI
ncbi:hypothetical protein PsorP6_019466 [Peronosclerospora sorghi]|nr:hypothetical protein PsorP6_019466 [Peronosclerospora sorghi]